MTFDFIQGNRFKNIAKFIYAPARLYLPKNSYRNDINNLPANDYRYLANTLKEDQLQDGDIIYTHTFYADQLFEKALNWDKKIKVITHNSDTPADFIPPPNVTWFTTNVNIKHPRVYSIPIGIENDFWLKDKKDKMLKKTAQKKRYKNLLYLNHNIKTNPSKRQKPYEIFSGLSWVTTNTGANGQGFDNYLDNIYNHPFVVCPEGNGIDTHRIWECLYMATIPIQIRNINNQFYTDLPILFVDDWEEITERFLHDEFMRIVDMKWNTNKLWFEYWKNYVVSQ